MTCQYSSRWLDIIINGNFAWSIRALMTSRWSDDYRYTIPGRITSSRTENRCIALNQRGMVGESSYDESRRHHL
jgi:hypothetical protein